MSEVSIDMISTLLTILLIIINSGFQLRKESSYSGQQQ